MGFWINPAGRWYHIPDHYNFIKTHPKMFGWSSVDVASWTLRDRDSILSEVKRVGWVRVRGTSPNLSMEFWKLDNNTIANIKDFLISEQVDPDEKILFKEESLKRDPWYEPASWILDDDALKWSRNPRRWRK